MTRKWNAYQCGQDCPHAKLTEEQVKEIRARRANKELLKTIAYDYNISEMNVSHICLRQSWKHVE